MRKKILDDGRIPILPYTRPHGNPDHYKPWEYQYDPVKEALVCPKGEVLRHTTTDMEGKRTYRSTPKTCRSCPCREKCGAGVQGQKVIQRHVWYENLELAEQLRKTERGRELYARRKETIERVFGDAKEKHAMRYTHHRGLTRVTQWVRLKFVCMNLKKWARWEWENSCFLRVFAVFWEIITGLTRFCAA